MGYLRVRRSIKIAPGVKLNLNKKSASVTVGPKGAHYTVSSNGSRTKTAGIPGTGVSVVDRKRPTHASTPPTAPRKATTQSHPNARVSHEVEFGAGGAGRTRSFSKGLFLSIITVGFYYYFWYYLVNDELKDIGIARDDRKLSDSKPAMSVAAVFPGGWLIVPPLLSVYNYGQRIKHAQRITSVPSEKQINPTVAFTTALFGFLIVPLLYHFAYVTKHQNRAVLAAGQLRTTAPSDHVALSAHAVADVPDLAARRASALAEGPDLAAIAHGTGDVPRTIAGRDSLIESKPRGWEYILFGSEMFLGVWALEPSWNAFVAGKGSGEGRDLDQFGTRDCISGALRRAGAVIGNTESTLLPKSMELAFGKPGEPGDQAEIQALAHRVVRMYEDLLNTVSSVRAQRVPRSFGEPIELLAEYLGSPMVQTRRFVADWIAATDDTAQKIANHRPGDPPITLVVTFEMKTNAPLREELEQSVRVAMGLE